MDDKEDGFWTSWHQDGKKAGEGHYSNGEKIGEWKEWYEDGTEITKKVSVGKFNSQSRFRNTKELSRQGHCLLQ